MDNFLIRPMVADDTSSFRTLHAKSWREHYANETEGVSQEWVNQQTEKWLTPESIAESKEYFSKAISDPDQLLKVAVENGEMIGFVHVSKHDSYNELDGLYVDSSHHGSGLAQKLMNETFPWLNQTKPTKLEVVRYNARAIRFYEKLGFRVIAGSDHLFKDFVPVVDMIKNPS